MKTLLLIICILLGNGTASSAREVITRCPADSSGGPSSEKSNSTFSYDKEREVLVITFDEAMLRAEQPEQAAYLSEHKCYPIDAPYVLPDEVAASLQADKQIVVKAGVYPVVYLDGVFIITIEL